MEEVSTKQKHKDYHPEQRQLAIKPYSRGRGGESLADENKFELNTLVKTIIAGCVGAKTIAETLRIDKFLRGKSDRKIISDLRMRTISFDQLVERIIQLFKHEQVCIMEHVGGFLQLQGIIILGYVLVNGITCVITAELDTTNSINRWKIYSYEADISNWPGGNYVISTCEASSVLDLFEPQEELVGTIVKGS